MKNLIVSFIALLSIVLSSHARAVPVLGESIYYSGGSLSLEILEPTTPYYSELGLYATPGSTALFVFGENNDVGKIVDFNPADLGFAAGDELVFGIMVLSTGREYFSGDPTRNPDGLAHAVVESLGGGEFYVGFEDMYGGDDSVYDDFHFILSGESSNPVVGEVPEPAPAFVLFLGLMTLYLKRRFTREPRLKF